MPVDGGGSLRARRLALAGAGGSSLGTGAGRRAALTELSLTWLRELWTAATTGHPAPIDVGSGVALACTGSLARGDGGPLSDLDLVLLHDGRSGIDLDELATRLWYPVWDSGVGLDHAVRTPAQCRQVAGGDLAVAAAVLDLAPVAGEETLVAATRHQLAEDWRAQSRRRLPELVESVHERHQQAGDLAQSLQPDLKEARGGLRDMGVLRALARSWLADRPHGDLDVAAGRLLDVRDAVQLSTGRARNVLTREEQQPVAELLGLGDADELLTEVSRASRVVQQALTATLRRAGQSQRTRLRWGPRRPQLEPLGDGLYRHDGEVVLGRGHDLEDPLLTLRAARAAAGRGLPLAPTTVANLAARGRQPSRPWGGTARELLVELLGSGDGVFEVWESLDQSGVVQHWLPAWAAVRGRPQRNSLHRHTVDRHLLETVRQAVPAAADSARGDLLLVAALLHDIGKIAGARDHSVTGAEIAGPAALGLGFDAADARVVSRLVAEHLTLITLATSRDLDDPGTVAAARAAVDDDPAQLDLLVALTEADARAVGAAAWTPWRATLLRSLATRVRSDLAGVATRGGGDDRDAEHVGTGRR